MATAPSHLKTQPLLTLPGYTMTVADCVDGLWYMPDAMGNLIVAAGNVLCGVPNKRAKVNDPCSVVFLGVVLATASGAISTGVAVTCDSGGKIKAASVGTDQVHGFLMGPATTTDGDICSVLKVS
jgi:hypothetical protein